MQEFAKGGHSVSRCSSPLSRGVLDGRDVDELRHCNAEPNSADMLINTIVCREGEKIAPQTHISTLHKTWSRHETPDFIDRTSRYRSRSVHDNLNSEAGDTCLPKQDSRNFWKWDRTS